MSQSLALSCGQPSDVVRFDRQLCLLRRLTWKLQTMCNNWTCSCETSSRSRYSQCMLHQRHMHTLTDLISAKDHHNLGGPSEPEGQLTPGLIRKVFESAGGRSAGTGGSGGSGCG
jgi:hypothetical protein